MNTNPLTFERTITVAMTERLIANLDEAAVLRGVTRSEIVRMLLYRGLDWLNDAPVNEMLEALHYARMEDAFSNIGSEYREKRKV